MTYQTKAQLRQDIAWFRDYLDEATVAKDAAEGALRKAGAIQYTHRTQRGDGRIHESPRWALPRIDISRERFEALNLVIDALNLTQYHGEPARFEKDLTTALRVRADREAQEEAERTEAAIANLLNTAAQSASEAFANMANAFAPASTPETGDVK